MCILYFLQVFRAGLGSPDPIVPVKLLIFNHLPPSGEFDRPGTNSRSTVAPVILNFGQPLRG